MGSPDVDDLWRTREKSHSIMRWKNLSNVLPWHSIRRSEKLGKGNRQPELFELLGPLSSSERVPSRSLVFSHRPKLEDVFQMSGHPTFTFVKPRRSSDILLAFGVGLPQAQMDPIR